MTYEVKIVADLRDNRQENVLHYDYIGPNPGPPSLLQATELAQAVLDSGKSGSPIEFSY